MKIKPVKVANLVLSTVKSLPECSDGLQQYAYCHLNILRCLRPVHVDFCGRMIPEAKTGELYPTKLKWVFLRAGPFLLMWAYLSLSISCHSACDG
jgi:hypothetical protein